MKKHNFAYSLLAAVLALGLFGCPIENEEFVSSTNNSVSNNEATLGLIGNEVSSSNTNVATVAIAFGKIVITSVAKGTATITVSNGANNATISVTVAANGSITIGQIVKYSPGNNMQVYYYSNGGAYTGSTKVWANDVQIGVITNGLLSLYSPLPDISGTESPEDHAEHTYSPNNVSFSVCDEFFLGEAAPQPPYTSLIMFGFANADLTAWVVYWWFDQNCTVDGTFSFEQGWNKVLMTDNGPSALNPSTFPADMKWYVYSDP
jgi:hypothetical protein